jgi:predicted NBD/HSP70 family sugar kinase
MRILAIDVGGSHAKALVTGHTQPVRIPSGPTFTAKDLVRGIERAVAGWNYDVVSIGVPAAVVHGKLASEPRNLGTGWVGFNFRRAFGRPVQLINDAAMQALGSYEGGRMLFLGLGTGLGSALIVDGVIEPMELARLPYTDHRTYEDAIGEKGRKSLGNKKWRRRVNDVIKRLKTALEVDDVVIGGGNVKRLRTLPAGVRRGSNAHAFTGGYRLWKRAAQMTKPARKRKQRG